MREMIVVRDNAMLVVFRALAGESQMFLVREMGRTAILLEKEKRETEQVLAYLKLNQLERMLTKALAILILERTARAVVIFC